MNPVISICLILLAVANLRADEALTNSYIASGNLLKLDQDNFACRITCHYADEPFEAKKNRGSEKKKKTVPQDDKRISLHEMIKIGSSRKDMVTDRSGNTSTRWTFDDIQMIDSGPNPPIIIEGQEASDYVHYGTDNFPEFSWLAKGNFAGIKKYNGRDCFVFKSSLTDQKAEIPARSENVREPSNAKGTGSIGATAYVDVETHLPVLLLSGEQWQEYSFVTPAASLPIPEELRKNAEDRKARINEIMRSMPRH